MKNGNEVIIDSTSNERYYIILVDGKEFAKVSKANNLEAVKQHFGIGGNE